jgi:hypothetical protein
MLVKKKSGRTGSEALATTQIYASPKNGDLGSRHETGHGRTFRADFSTNLGAQHRSRSLRVYAALRLFHLAESKQFAPIEFDLFLCGFHS